MGCKYENKVEKWMHFFWLQVQVTTSENSHFFVHRSHFESELHLTPVAQSDVHQLKL